MVHKNKKGFTLIELLAVIVILAVIALIATPIILNMMESAKKSSAKDSAYGYIKAIEYETSLADLQGKKYEDKEDYTYNEIKVNIKGEAPTGGRYSLKNGVVISGIFCINGYTVNYADNTMTVVDKGCTEDSLKYEGKVVLSSTSGDYTYPNSGTFTVKHHGGALSCETSDKEVATCSIEGNVVTVIPGTKEDSATLTITSASTEKYKVAQAAYLVKTVKGTLNSYTVTGYSGEYDEEAHGITITSSGATIKYGLSEGIYNLTESPKYTDVGEYTVYYEITKAGYNIITGSEKIIIKDTTAPNLTLGDIEKTTKSIIIPYISEDKASGIKNTICEYGTSTSYGNKGTISDNKCVINDLTSGTMYYYKITTTDGSGISTDVFGNTNTLETGTCNISVTDEQNWTKSKIATITGTTSTGEKLQYRVVSGTTEKVAWTTINSGTTKTIDWEASTTTPTDIYCRVTDEKNTKDGETKTITKIDLTGPVLSNLTNSSGGNWTNQNITLKYNVNESESGIDYCQYKYANDVYGSCGVWCNHDVMSENGLATAIYSAERNTTTYLRCFDKAGNVSNELSTPIKIDTTAPSTPSYTNSSGGNWTNQNIVINASSTDSASGISKFQWGYDDTPWYDWTTGTHSTITNGKTVSDTWIANINKNLWIRACDVAGNCSTSVTTLVRIDKTPPTCTVSGGTNNWIASSQKITGTCSDSGGSSCKSASVTATYSKSSGYYDSYYSPGTVSDNAGNSVACGTARVRVTGTTLSDYATGSKVFMYDGKTGLSGTTWTDQSGNGRNATLIGSTISGNSVYLSGSTSSYVRIAQLNYSAVTMEMVFKPMAVGKLQQLMSNISAGGYAIEINAANVLGAESYKNGGYRWAGTSNTVTTNKIYYGAGRLDSSYSRATLNGVTTTTAYSGNIVTTEGGTYIILGGNPWTNYSDDANATFKGYIYAARMYSRVLSDDEIYKNYVIDRARFGF